MKKLFLFAVLLASIAACSRNNGNEKHWPASTREAKPWTRWWWMGNAVDAENLPVLMKTYAAAGFGGVEIAPIYGAVGYEDKYLPFLSPAWMEILRLTVREAGNNNMGVDMTLGTGWPFGGPQVTLPMAASRLIIQQWKIKAGKPFRERIVLADARQKRAGASLQSLIARNEEGEFVDILSFVEPDGTLTWKPDAGEWEITATFSGLTLQKVKRAAPGGEGYTMDHFSRKALDQYLTRFDSAFAGNSQGVRSFFNDSYEVYGTNWTPDFFNEFERRRGYPLQPWVKMVTSQEDTTETAARIRYDYRQTISELLLENFTVPWTDWAAKNQSKTRNQAHGSPGNLLDLYGAVDIPECETFGSSYFPIPGLRRDSADIRNVDPDPVMLKFASSAAHVTGKNLVSSESFTWLAEHFKVSLSQCKPEVEQLFLAGTNHVFYHGTTYSPASVPWPGWLFYASVNFAPSNSFWPHLPGLNQYITRCQSVLQSGQPVNDLLMYWPLPDYWMQPANNSLQMTVHDIDKWLHPTPFYREVTRLQNQGYGIDFVSDKLLKQIKTKDNLLSAQNGTTWQTLIFPALQYLPSSTFLQAIELAKKGAIVIFQSLPGDVPGLADLTERRTNLESLISGLALSETAPGVLSAKTGAGEIIVTEDISSILTTLKIEPETLVQSGLKYIKRKNEQGTWYYLVNHTPDIIDTWLELKEPGSYCLLDPQDGSAGLAEVRKEDEKELVRVRLEPGETQFLLAAVQSLKAEPWKYDADDSSSLKIPGPWTLTFKEGGPGLPAERVLPELQNWTDISDDLTERFSGTASYKTHFTLQEPLASDYLLQLNGVHESARVLINGKDAGIAWSIPFKLRVGKFLKKGENTLEIEVANLMANRIRWMDQQKMEWRKYHEINFVNINYKNFDASGWEVMPSGLEGPVRLVPFN